MSDYVRYKGELKKIDMAECNLEQWCKEDFIRRGVVGGLPSWFDSYGEYIVDEFYDEYVLVNGELYEIVEKKRLYSEFDMFNGKVLENGNIEFDTMYYNGGYGFSDAMERVVDNLGGE